MGFHFASQNYVTAVPESITSQAKILLHAYTPAVEQSSPSRVCINEVVPRRHHVPTSKFSGGVTPRKKAEESACLYLPGHYKKRKRDSSKRPLSVRCMSPGSSVSDPPACPAPCPPKPKPFRGAGCPFICPPPGQDRVGNAYTAFTTRPKRGSTIPHHPLLREGSSRCSS